MIDTVTLSTPELGNRTYLIHNGRRGVVIDPQRDTDRVLRAAAAAGVRIAYVAETHVHNDYVSGGWALASELGVPYLVAAAEEVCFARHAVRDGDEVVVDPHFSLRVVATPGHTPHHVAYIALDRGRPTVAATGGSLLYGTVGRTDLFGAALAAPLARHQYHSVHSLGQLPGWVEVLPTHGFGSFCSVGASGIDTSTIAEQRSTNLVFRADSEEAFVHQLLDALGDYPRYYHQMAGPNRQGAPAPDLSPPPRLDAARLATIALTDAWVVDLRGRGAFAAGHLTRSINVEQDTPFTTYLGWLLPHGAPLVLMAEHPKAIAHAQIDLARIGIDAIAGQYVGVLPPQAIGRAVHAYPVGTFYDLARVVGTTGNVALDVRRDDEWSAGHLDGALHVPLHQLIARIDDLPAGTIWVHCAAGYRAAIAASLLERHGRSVVLVDGRFSPVAG